MDKAKVIYTYERDGVEHNQEFADSEQALRRAKHDCEMGHVTVVSITQGDKVIYNAEQIVAEYERGIGEADGFLS